MSIHAEDERALRIVRASRLARMLHGAIAVFVTAWSYSSARTLFARIVDRLPEQGVPARARLAGGVTAVASVTALAMQRLAPRPLPLMWIVPSVFLFAGACLFLGSRERPIR